MKRLLLSLLSLSLLAGNAFGMQGQIPYNIIPTVQQAAQTIKNEFRNAFLTKNQQVFAEAQETGEICGICRDDFNSEINVSILKCKHIFHTDCLQQWINQSNDGRCPACRKEITLPLPIHKQNMLQNEHYIGIALALFFTYAAYHNAESFNIKRPLHELLTDQASAALSAFLLPKYVKISIDETAFENTLMQKIKGITSDSQSKAIFLFASCLWSISHAIPGNEYYNTGEGFITGHILPWAAFSLIIKTILLGLEKFAARYERRRL